MKTFSDVIRLIQGNYTEAPALKLFAFGSRMHGGVGEDYDILFIEDNVIVIELFRKKLIELTHDLPIHLTVLTPAEVTETGFLRKTGAVPFSSLV